MTDSFLLHKTVQTEQRYYSKRNERTDTTTLPLNLRMSTNILEQHIKVYVILV